MRQESAILFNGQVVKYGDIVSFINSDGEKCTAPIRRKINGRLYFWNIGYAISSYKSAIKEA